MTDWKQQHANDAERAFEHEVVTDTVAELLANIRRNVPGAPLGLIEYGIWKVASAVAQVARAEALGIDPDALRLSRDEEPDEMVKLVRAFAEAGKPVIVVTLEDDAGD